MLKHAILLGALLGLPALADETTGEKARDSTNDAKRSINSTVHRTEEELCTGSKTECSKKKAEHHAIEAKDTADDKAQELRDKAE